MMIKLGLVKKWGSAVHSSIWSLALNALGEPTDPVSCALRGSSVPCDTRQYMDEFNFNIPADDDVTKIKLGIYGCIDRLAEPNAVVYFEFKNLVRAWALGVEISHQGTTCDEQVQSYVEWTINPATSKGSDFDEGNYECYFSLLSGAAGLKVGRVEALYVELTYSSGVVARRLLLGVGK